jgi:hypothetical protein
LGIRHTCDPVALQRAFEAFHYWDNIRGICQVLAFVAELWALAVLTGNIAVREPGTRHS